MPTTVTGIQSISFPLESFGMRGIEFEVIWFDQDAIELRVMCSNGSFCGTAKMYLAHDDLSKAAQTLSGFPSSIEDSRRVQLGAIEPNSAGGGIEMTFRCIDSAGHAVVDVRLTAEGDGGNCDCQSVFLRIPVEAAAIDSFVEKARTVDDTKGAKAYLGMADRSVA
jgi:hypothetical protein